MVLYSHLDVMHSSQLDYAFDNPTYFSHSDIIVQRNTLSLENESIGSWIDIENKAIKGAFAGFIAEGNQYQNKYQGRS